MEGQLCVARCVTDLWRIASSTDCEFAWLRIFEFSQRCVAIIFSDNRSIWTNGDDPGITMRSSTSTEEKRSTIDYKLEPRSPP